MSQITVLVPPALRKFVAGKARVQVEAGTVRQALEAFSAGSAHLREYLFDQGDGLRRFVRVFVDGQPKTVLVGHEEPVAAGAEMTILIALAGG